MYFLFFATVLLLGTYLHSLPCDVRIVELSSFRLEIPNVFAVEEPLKLFSYPQEPLSMKRFTGQKEFIAGAQLNYC